MKKIYTRLACVAMVMFGHANLGMAETYTLSFNALHENVNKNQTVADRSVYSIDFTSEGIAWHMTLTPVYKFGSNTSISSSRYLKSEYAKIDGTDTYEIGGFTL